MSYQPVDQIPLQDLSGESDGEVSDLSVIFTEIGEYNLNKDPEDFLADPQFQQTLSRFNGKGGITKKACFFVTLAIFLLWLIALIAYSNGNARKVASGVWHGSPTDQVLLHNRNITLNSFLPKNHNVSFETYRRGMYFPDRKDIRWLNPVQFPSDGNGYYMVLESDGVVIRQADSNYKFVLVENTEFEYGNNFFQLQDIVLNPNKAVDDGSTYHILKSDEIRQWRHSSFSLFWLWQPVTGKVIPIQPPGYDGTTALEKLHLVQFSPSGDFLVFGHNHDLYVMDVSTQVITRVTNSASRDIFNGKPDWIYEEEVVADDNMVWWSPDLKKMVYATLNDTDVGDYDVRYYIKQENEVAMSYKRSQYPIRTSIKYPKPGTNNPIVALHVFDVDLETISPIDVGDNTVGTDFILYDAVWIDADHMLVKVADRTSSVLEKKVYVTSENTVRFVSRTNTSEYSGWVEKAQPVTLVKANPTKYLDRVVANNVVQLALFDLALSSNYSMLLGPVHYESAVAYDDGENAVYAVWGTNNNQLFGLVSLSDGLQKLLGPGMYEPYFSPDGHHVQLAYEGPDEPWQKVVNVAHFADSEFSLDSIEPMNNMRHLSDALSTTNVPTRVNTQVQVGHGKSAVHLNMIEIFPPNFDPSRKYPLLVNAYGGPGSTSVDDLFTIDFHDIVSAQHDAVVLIIDPRGTGSDDWTLKLLAYKNLGYWEPRDLVDVVEDYVKVNLYVDDKRTALWGWSYGGFTTLKTLEHDAGRVFKYGMAVAPVTNWLFYDSIYTERYMKNPGKHYENAQISQIDNFKTVKRFLIMHGTADDNVHLQNTLWLMDKFDLGGVENYDVHFFPDSDHSIYYHNANAIVYDKLFLWLGKAFRGEYDRW